MRLKKKKRYIGFYSGESTVIRTQRYINARRTLRENNSNFDKNKIMFMEFHPINNLTPKDIDEGHEDTYQ